MFRLVFLEFQSLVFLRDVLTTVAWLYRKAWHIQKDNQDLLISYVIRSLNKIVYQLDSGSSSAKRAPGGLEENIGPNIVSNDFMVRSWGHRPLKKFNDWNNNEYLNVNVCITYAAHMASFVLLDLYIMVLHSRAQSRFAIKTQQEKYRKTFGTTTLTIIWLYYAMQLICKIHWLEPISCGPCKAAFTDRFHGKANSEGEICRPLDWRARCIDHDSYETWYVGEGKRRSITQSGES